MSGKCQNSVEVRTGRVKTVRTDLDRSDKGWIGKDGTGQVRSSQV